MCNSASWVGDLLATVNQEHGRSTCDRQLVRHPPGGLPPGQRPPYPGVRRGQDLVAGLALGLDALCAGARGEVVFSDWC